MLLSIIRSKFRRLRTALAVKIKSLFMKPNVHLYIQGKEVEFSESPNILYNWSIDDATSPAAVKNSYSKTVKVPGTPNNNAIFGSIWNLTRQDNPTMRGKLPFSIYLDGDLYETGYARLDNFTRNKGKLEYNITLFGGLGSFFYSLDYVDDNINEAHQKKLSDLVFRMYGEPEDDEVDLSFTINMGTVQDAWDNIDGYTTKWKFINFCPTAYNGIPSDFDADKVMIIPGRTSASRTLPATETKEGETYIALGGYAIAEMDRERTEAEMREFRSYLQRPVISVKEVITACCNPENNGGYKVNLDPEFFNYDNPYWNDMWCTLPLLTSLDYTGSEDSDGEITAQFDGTEASGYSYSGYTMRYWMDYPVAVSGQVNDAINVTLDFKVGADISDSNFDWWGLCGYRIAEDVDFAGGIGLQLVAFDVFGNAVAGSDYLWLTTVHHHIRTGSGGRVDSGITYGPSNFNYNFYGTDYSQSTGTFDYVNGTYMWCQGLRPNTNVSTFSLRIKNVPAGCTIKLLVTKLGINAIPRNTYPDYERERLVFHNASEPGNGSEHIDCADLLNVNIIDPVWTVDVISADSIRTGAKFTKKDILNTDYSPLDFLLSYTKLFGLYFRKDPVKDEIDILTRGKFFNPTGTPIDINDKIDLTDQTVKLTAFDKKWYRWDLEKEDSEFGKDYEKVYGKPYGEQKINTGYDFNNDTEDVLDGNIFKGAVQCVERSTDFCFSPRWPNIIPWEYADFKYQLYGQDDSSKTTEVEIPPASMIDAFSGITSYKYYDITDKVQLHSEDNSPAQGGSVLLFRWGMADLTAPGGASLGYYITDDNSFMSVLNQGKSCWLRTNSETDKQGNRVAIAVDEVPKFGRYEIYPTSGYILKSLDFGEPETVFIPNARLISGATMYNLFWEDYISDLYNKNTVVLNTKMLIEEKPSIDWLRKWYLYDNCLWRLSKIKDYNIGTYGLTSVELVKVNDPANYANRNWDNNPALTFTISINEVPKSGGTATWAVTVSDGGHWYMEYGSMGGTTVTVNGLDQYGGGTGDSTGTVVFGANQLGSTETYYFYVFADPASARIILEQPATTFNVTKTSVGDIPAEGGNATFQIVSDDPWTAYTEQTSYATLSPTTGGTTTGETLTMTLQPNTDFSTRYASIVATNGSTTYRNPYAVIQLAGAGKSAVLQPPYNYYFPASGTARTMYVNCTDPWALDTYGIASTDLPVAPIPTSVTSFTYTLPANTMATKYDMVRARLYDYPAIQSSAYYIYQWPTFALFYNTNNNQTLTPTNTSTGFQAGILNYANLTENTYRYHKVGNDYYQPFGYSYEMAFDKVVTIIENQAFSGCTGLTSIYCSGVTELGNSVFRNCTNLTDIEIPDVTEIAINAFAGTTKLKSITLSGSLSSLGYHIFDGSGCETINFGGTMAQWNNVSKTLGWSSGSVLTQVVCTDGTITL